MNDPKLNNNIILKILVNAFVVTIFVIYFSLNASAQNVDDNLRVRVVVIDAGHGGKDGGTVGKLDLEKDIALSIALKAGKYIEDNIKDVKVIYTRKTDVFIELFERAKIANRADADLFMSIHVNAFTNPKPYGTGSYVMGLAKNDANMRAAKRENKAILLEDNYQERYENFDPNSPESYIALTLQQSAFLNQSLDIASKVQDQFRERIGRFDRGVKQAPFLVLHQTTMPSVLIETGFITNPEEAKFLNSEIGQDYLASAIYRAFKEYKLGIEEKLESSFKMAEKLKEEQNVPSSKGIDGLVFKVQIATSSTKIDLSPSNFKGLKNVDVYEAGGLFRYTYGNSGEMNKAVSLQEEVRKNGYKDAFIVAFLNGTRISVGEANKLIDKSL